MNSFKKQQQAWVVVLFHPEIASASDEQFHLGLGCLGGGGGIYPGRMALRTGLPHPAATCHERWTIISSEGTVSAQKPIRLKILEKIWRIFRFVGLFPISFAAFMISAGLSRKK